MLDLIGDSHVFLMLYEKLNKKIFVEEESSVLDVTRVYLFKIRIVYIK
jgi:hypothetical protein